LNLQRENPKRLPWMTEEQTREVFESLRPASLSECAPRILAYGGWWYAFVTFEGRARYIALFGSETQAKGVAERFRAAFTGESDKLQGPKARRGAAGKPGAPL
jgi:hypothetical protein